MRTYRLVPPDQVPADAVVVNLWKVAGRTVADIVCSTNSKARHHIAAELPRPVPDALQRAEELRSLSGAAEIAVVLLDLSLWRNEWGILAPVHPTQGAGLPSQRA